MTRVAPERRNLAFDHERDDAEAERYLRLALPVQAAQYDATSPTLADSRLSSARTLAEQGKTAQAQELLKSARAALARHLALAAYHERLLEETTRLVAVR